MPKWLTPLPYGLFDLDPNIQTDPGPPFRVRCYVQGCTGDATDRQREVFAGTHALNTESAHTALAPR